MYNSLDDGTSSRYVLGGVTETSGRFAEWWERKKIPAGTDDKYYILEKMYENRPDLLSYAVYNDTKLWWIILQYNNILDPLTEFVAGAILRIPNKDRVMAFLEADLNIGGIPSKRIL